MGEMVMVSRALVEQAMQCVPYMGETYYALRAALAAGEAQPDVPDVRDAVIESLTRQVDEQLAWIKTHESAVGLNLGGRRSAFTPVPGAAGAEKTPPPAENA